MNERVKRLTEEIRKLPPEEQAEIIDELIVLTYREPDPEIDKVWAQEARDRLEAWRRGELPSRSAGDVLGKYRKP